MSQNKLPILILLERMIYSIFIGFIIFLMILRTIGGNYPISAYIILSIFMGFNLAGLILSILKISWTKVYTTMLIILFTIINLPINFALLQQVIKGVKKGMQLQGHIIKLLMTFFILASLITFLVFYIISQATGDFYKKEK